MSIGSVCATGACTIALRPTVEAQSGLMPKLSNRLLDNYLFRENFA
jgi:hypothetical protein